MISCYRTKINILEKNPDKWHLLFRTFRSNVPFFVALCPFDSPHIFFRYIPHGSKIANTPILQSRNPPVSFPSFVLTSQLVPIFIFQIRIPPPPFFLNVANQLHNIIPSPLLGFLGLYKEDYLHIFKRVSF